jgi:hypothetical protein
MSWFQPKPPPPPPPDYTGKKVVYRVTKKLVQTYPYYCWSVWNAEFHIGVVEFHGKDSIVIDGLAYGTDWGNEVNCVKIIEVMP